MARLLRFGPRGESLRGPTCRRQTRVSVYAYRMHSGSSVKLRAARIGAGLSIRELASHAEVAASTVWRIETGRLDPTVGMLERLLSAAGAGVERRTEPTRATREEAVSLALGQMTAAAVLRDPDRTLNKARNRVLQTLGTTDLASGARRWILEWSRLLDGPLEGVVAALIDPTERGYELRQNTPFTGLISAEDRLRAVRRATRSHRAARSA